MKLDISIKDDMRKWPIKKLKDEVLSMDAYVQGDCFGVRDMIYLSLLMRELESRGYEVEEVSNGHRLRITKR